MTSTLVSRRQFITLISGAMAYFWISTDAIAAPQQAVTSVMDHIQAMKPGDYLWVPLIAPSGPIIMVISLSVQRCYVYRNGVLIGAATISSGKPGHLTPTGVFTVLQKQVHHKSNLYDSAPMPYMQRLTWSGVAMHAGNLPGYPASHGCVRMPADFAKLLYKETARGMTVVIADLDAVPRIAPTPDVLQGEEASASVETGDAVWEPEKSASGPLSLILSGADSRLVVLRNGILIGSAPVNIQGAITETTAYSLSKVDPQGFHWMQLPLPGQSWEGDKELSAVERARVSIPDPFRKVLDDLLTLGVTLVVTGDSLRAGATGQKVTIIEAEQPTK